jgi:hypothetical protein
MNSNLLALLANPTVANPAQSYFDGAKQGNALRQYANAAQADELTPAAMRGEPNALARLGAVDFDRANKIQTTDFEQRRQTASDGRAAGVETRAQGDYDRKVAADKAQRIASIVYNADTPKKFDQAVTLLRAQGVNLPQGTNFSQRQLLIDQATTVAEHAKNGVDLAKVAASAGNDYGLNPILTQAPDGTVNAYQASKTGSVKPMQFPNGERVMGPADKAAATTTGKAQGTATVNLSSVENTARRMIEQLDAVGKDPGLSSVTGFIGGRTPRVAQFPGQAALQSKIDQIQGNTFLSAYESLRGAGAITEQEGQAAKDAITRLGTQAMSAKEYRTALAEARREINKLVDLARQKAGKGTPAAGGDSPTPGSFTWTPDGGLTR